MEEPELWEQEPSTVSLKTVVIGFIIVCVYLIFMGYVYGS